MDEKSPMTWGELADHIRDIPADQKNLPAVLAMYNHALGEEEKVWLDFEIPFEEGEPPFLSFANMEDDGTIPAPDLPVTGPEEPVEVKGPTRSELEEEYRLLEGHAIALPENVRRKKIREVCNLLNKCKCRNCTKEYDARKSRATYSGYCSQSCLNAKGHALGYRKKHDVNTNPERKPPCHLETKKPDWQ